MKTILIDAVYTFVVESDRVFKPFKQMYNMLETFPNRKIILTSANDEQFKKFNLAEMPYEVFTLKHNPEKTDPKYYEEMLKYFSLKKDDVFYFEHDKNAVESAKVVGIKTYHYDSERKDLISLKDFLTENYK